MKFNINSSRGGHFVSSGQLNRYTEISRLTVIFATALRTYLQVSVASVKLTSDYLRDYSIECYRVEYNDNISPSSVRDGKR